MKQILKSLGEGLLVNNEGKSFILLRQKTDKETYHKYLEKGLPLELYGIQRPKEEIIDEDDDFGLAFKE